MRPGKPVMFGKSSSKGTNRLFLGLPGNPVSSLVCTMIFAVPIISKMLGLNSDPSNKVAFSFYGGVQFDLLTNAYTYNDNPAYIPPLTDVVSKFPTTYEIYNPVHFSVVGDIGTDISASLLSNSLVSKKSHR